MVDPNRGDGEPYAIVRQMGLTHTEFLRSLPAAVGGMSLQREGPQILIEDATRRVEIQLGPERQRRLGSLVLPLSKINLVFRGFSPEERERFLRRFDLTFHRGGG